jgi:hypothetical protein
LKTVLVNCSDDNFLKQRNLNSRSARLFGGFDQIYSFSTSDIDPEFRAQHDKILSQKRGAGYWLWKPYFINKVYQELNEGDYLFYCDAGALFINNVRHLIKALEQTTQSVMPFELPLIEYEWTAESVLRDYRAFETGAAYSNQICATYLLIRKSEQSDLFIQRWFAACQRADHITDDVVLGPLAKAHRHDQSVLSLVCKEFGLQTFKDPSDYGRFPWRYFAFGRTFRTNSLKHLPVIVLSVRKSQPFIYLFKYFARVFVVFFTRRKHEV